MSIPTAIKHIVRDGDILGGKLHKPHIEGHRIAVHHIAWWYQQGETAEAIAHEYGLTPAEVHAALAYYYDHKAEIDGDIVREAAEHSQAAAADTSPIAARMRAAIAARKRQRTDA
jgi:uncharacterized protein (DUF433 family)